MRGEGIGASEISWGLQVETLSNNSYLYNRLVDASAFTAITLLQGQIKASK